MATGSHTSIGSTRVVTTGSGTNVGGNELLEFPLSAEANQGVIRTGSTVFITNVVQPKVKSGCRCCCCCAMCAVGTILVLILLLGTLLLLLPETVVDNFATSLENTFEFHPNRAYLDSYSTQRDKTMVKSNREAMSIIDPAMSQTQNSGSRTTSTTSRYRDPSNASRVGVTSRQPANSSAYISMAMPQSHCTVGQPVRSTTCAVHLYGCVVCALVTAVLLVIVTIMLLLFLPESVTDDIATKLEETFGNGTITNFMKLSAAQDNITAASS